MRSKRLTLTSLLPSYIHLLPLTSTQRNTMLHQHTSTPAHLGPNPASMRRRKEKCQYDTLFSPFLSFSFFIPSHPALYHNPMLKANGKSLSRPETSNDAVYELGMLDTGCWILDAWDVRWKRQGKRRVRAKHRDRDTETIAQSEFVQAQKLTHC